MIEEYSFGRITISGQQFTSDLIIFPDGKVLDSWWRQMGHRLTFEDILPLIETKPEVIVAGTGASGLMKPVAELTHLLARQEIEFVASSTGKAVDIYNRLVNQKKVGACLHLTC